MGFVASLVPFGLAQARERRRAGDGTRPATQLVSDFLLGLFPRVRWQIITTCFNQPFIRLASLGSREAESPRS